MTFDDWWADGLDFYNGDDEQILATVKAAANRTWDAAMTCASKIAFDTAKRYTCSKRRALCFAIADQIKKGQQ